MKGLSYNQAVQLADKYGLKIAVDKVDGIHSAGSYTIQGKTMTVGTSDSPIEASGEILTGRKAVEYRLMNCFFEAVYIHDWKLRQEYMSLYHELQNIIPDNGIRVKVITAKDFGEAEELFKGYVDAGLRS